MLIRAIETLRFPVYLSGMARGLLAPSHPLLLRHQRRKALKEADVIVLGGVPLDFRLNYGFGIPAKTHLISINRDPSLLRLNRRPAEALHGDPLKTLVEISRCIEVSKPGRGSWHVDLYKREQQREEEIRVGREKTKT